MCIRDRYAGTVSVFDVETLEPRGLVHVGDYPEGIAASADGRHVYVANWFDNTLSTIDAQTLKVVASVAVGEGPRAFGAFIRRDPAP